MSKEIWTVVRKLLFPENFSNTKDFSSTEWGAVALLPLVLATWSLYDSLSKKRPASDYFRLQLNVMFCSALVFTGHNHSACLNNFEKILAVFL